MPRQRDPLQRIQISLPVELRARVKAYHEALNVHGMPGSIQSTLVELVEQGMSNAPQDTATLAAKARAYVATVHGLSQRLLGFLAEQRLDMERSVTELAAGVHARCPHCQNLLYSPPPEDDR